MSINPGPSSQSRTNVEILTSENFGEFAVSDQGAADIEAALAAMGLPTNNTQLIAQANPTVYNFFPENYKNARAAIANTLLGISNTNVLMIGDSTTVGLNEGGVANEVAFSNVTQLAKLLTARGLAANSQNVMGDHSSSFVGTTLPIIDTRVTLGAGWSNSLSGGVGGGTISNNTTQNAFLFAPTPQTDTLDVYFLAAAGFDNISVLSGVAGLTPPLTGGTLVNPATNVLYKLTATNTLGQNIWSIAKATNNGNAVHIVALNAYNSAQKTVNLLNCGNSGRGVQYFTANVNYWDSLKEITGTAPLVSPLAIINIGINDWIAGMDQITFAGYLQTIVTALRAVNTDVVLVVPIPSSNSYTTVTAARQAAIVAGIYQVALANSLAVIDVTKRWTSFAASQPLGYYNGNPEVHGSKLGYMDVAAAMSSLFTQLGAV